MIKTLRIENFRSIKSLKVDLSMFNVLVGPNSSGKTNILRALDLLIGPAYPSVNHFDESDFYSHDLSKTITIEIRFGNPICYSHSLKRKTYNIYGFKLTFDGNEMNYVAIASDVNIPRSTQSTEESEFFEIKVNNEMREKVSMMYLPLDRQAYQQITPSQWKIYGKLLKHIEKNIEPDNKKKFQKGVEDSFENHISKPVEEAEKLLKKYVKELTGLDISLKLSIVDPTMVLKNLRPHITSTTGFTVDVEDEGAGVQSAVAIAIARAYAEIAKQPLVLAIEEPELYLHPHACRHFYKTLKEISQNGVQVIYTTHERSFVNIADKDSILLVKKENGGTKVYRCAPSLPEVEPLFDEEINEVFFADKVILVEGHYDKIACKLALEKLGIELDKHNISVIDCGGNQSIKPMVEILKNFNIDTYVLIDEDPGKPKTQQLMKEIRDLIGSDKVLLQSPNLEGIWEVGEGGKIDKKNASEIFNKWFINNAEPPKVYKELANKINLK